MTEVVLYFIVAVITMCVGFVCIGAFADEDDRTPLAMVTVFGGVLWPFSFALAFLYFCVFKQLLDLGKFLRKSIDKSDNRH
jgi:hypothetical protein